MALYTGPACLRFSYNFHGQTVGSLEVAQANVYDTELSESLEPVWREWGYSAVDWQTTSVLVDVVQDRVVT